MLADLYERIDLKIKKERKKLPWSSISEFRDELNRAKQANFSVYRDPYAHYRSLAELTPVKSRIHTKPSVKQVANFHHNDETVFLNAQQEILRNPPDLTGHDRGNRHADFSSALHLMETMGQNRLMQQGLLAAFQRDGLATSLSNYYKTLGADPPIDLFHSSKTALVELAVEQEGLNISDMKHHSTYNPVPI